VCKEVVENSKIWPSLCGINQSASKMKFCGLYNCGALFSIVYNSGIPVMICIFLLYIVTPSFILPLLQRTYYAYCEQNVLSRCSPVYRQAHAHALPQYHPIDTYTDYHHDTSTHAHSESKVKQV